MTVEAASAVLRYYKMAECDEHGVPLDWERCRTCGGTGWRGGAESLVTTGEGAVVGHMVPADAPEPTDDDVCGTCKGHGSLKAAALAALMKEPNEAGAVRRAAADYDRTGSPGDRRHLGEMEARLRAVRWIREARCEDCGHPMGDGTWEDRDGYGDEILRRDLLAQPFDGGTGLHGAVERRGLVHFSPCDEGCRHGGPFRWRDATIPPPDPWQIDNRPGGSVQSVWGLEPGYEIEASWRQVDVRTLDWPHDLRPESLALLCLRCWAGRVSGT